VAAVDAEVVEPGKADGLYINTSGVGCVEHRLALGPTAIREDDLVIVSGAIGGHGAALLAARAGVETAVRSDTAPLHTLVAKLLGATDEVRCLRQPTRGGIAGVLSELALAAAVGIAIEQSDIPIRSEVSAACEILDVNPQGLMSEGNLLAVVSPDATSDALAALRSHPLGREAAIIGEVTADDPGGVNFDVAVSAQGIGQRSIRR
jgi:hydrogenase expression/formation protein HypE